MRKIAQRHMPPWKDVLDHDCASLIARLRKGFPVALAIRVATALRLDKSELWKRVNLLQMRRQRSPRTSLLTSVESERIYRIAKVYSLASGILGDEENAVTWLLGRNRVLGGKDPLSLLDTQIGYEFVKDTLHRIQYGAIVS